MSALPLKKNELKEGYVLESEQEFARLERQSTFAKYDYRKELSLCALSIPAGARVLDAGCGSGVVSRYLAGHWPKAQVVGLDYAAERVRQAAVVAAGLGNLTFEQGDLSALKFENASFDVVISRYVLQHVADSKRLIALGELKRCLTPGGTIALIDFDGPFYNIYPQTALMGEVLGRLERESPVDLRIGRKLPAMLTEAGFSQVKWQIETIECQGTALTDEIEMVRDKLVAVTGFLSSFLGSAAKAEQFKKDYLETMRKPGLVLFYNKFLVTAVNPRSNVLKLVKG